MDNKEKVRLLRRHREIGRRNLKALMQWQTKRDEADREMMFAQFGLGGRKRVDVPELPKSEPYPDISGLTCGARTRAGTPCKITIIHSNGRCKFHGGRSTGAKTRAGRKRQRDGYRAWLEKQRASKAGRKRTRTYTSDVSRIDGVTLAEISASTPESALRVAEGIRLHLDGDRLRVELPGGHCAVVQLAATSPKYGGIRWWYVCPVCEKRKSVLYVSGSQLQCRQCAGLHYSSQRK